MATKKISSTLGQVGTSIESAFQRLVMGVRARHMPKSIKKVKHTLVGKSKTSNGTADSVYGRPDAMLDGTTFHPKYMGSTLVEEIIDCEPGANYFNTGSSTKALDRVIAMCHNKHLVKVALNITSQSIQVRNQADRELILDVPLDRVSFCANDRKYSKVTTIITKNALNGTMECHAFLCDKQRMAQAIAVTVGQVFAAGKVNSEAPALEGLDAAHSRRLSRDRTRELNSDIAKIEKMQISPHRRKSSLLTEINSNNNVIENDIYLPPVTRERSDSDSFAVLAAGSTQRSKDDNDLENEFSNFARSRSQTNLHELHASIHSGWDI